MSARSMVLIGMIAITVLSRLVDHPPNFTPLLAVALFGAAHFRSRWMGLAVPLAAMLISDLALEFTTRLGLHSGWMAKGWGFHGGMLFVYPAVVLTWLLGLPLRKHCSFLTVGTSSLAGSVMFYLITNFAWWPGYHEYPHTWEGLVQSYVAGIPFFGWTLAGTAFYGAVLFGGFALAKRRYPELQPALT